MGTAQVAALTDMQFKQLSTANVKALTSDQAKVLTQAQLGALTSAQIAAMDTVDVAQLTSTQIRYLGNSALNGLTTTQVNNLYINIFICIPQFDVYLFNIRQEQKKLGQSFVFPRYRSSSNETFLAGDTHNLLYLFAAQPNVIYRRKIHYPHNSFIYTKYILFKFNICMKKINKILDYVFTFLRVPFPGLIV
jgi:hypothetical protein